MNTVNISGMILDEPMLREEQNGALHLAFRLGVRHRTAAGEWRKEVYKVSAWHKAAQWGADNLAKGKLVYIQGYLTQHLVRNGDMSIVQVEIAADEFLPLQSGSDAKANRSAASAQGQGNAAPELTGAAAEMPSVESEYPIDGN